MTTLIPKVLKRFGYVKAANVNIVVNTAALDGKALAADLNKYLAAGGTLNR